MRGLLAGLLLIFSLSLFSQESGHFVLNPLTGEIEYVTNPYAIGDSLVNLGYDNNIDLSTLSTMIGFGNYLGSPDCISVGWDNNNGCGENFSMGKNLECNSEKVIMIGMAPFGENEARMPGSVAFCPGGDYGVLYVHSGYSMPNNGFVGNSGGVRIGRGSAYSDGTTALEVIGHNTEYIVGVDTFSYSTHPAAQLIATENDEWIVDPDEMTLAGSMEIGYLECDHVPKVHSAASDTSLLPTPLKIGDYYIDTSARDVYISTGTARGSWQKVN